jgi:branched-chain amino acid transport system permease protein
MFGSILIYGLVNAAIMSLVATGFNLTFGISGIPNFAYGAIYILAGFGVWMMLHMLGIPFLAAIPLMVLLTAGIGAGLYRLVLIRLRSLVLPQIIVTFGIGLVVLELFRFFGFTSFQYALPNFLDGHLVLQGVHLDYQRVFILALAVLTTGGLWFFTRYSRLGLALRGIAQEERTAMSLGIDPEWMSMLAMALGSGLCALAAVVILPIGTMSIDAGYEVLLQALAVCIVGGLGSALGVLVASLLLGLGQTFTAMYLGSHWMMIIVLIAILAVLAIRPSGLFGKQKELEDRL